MSILVYYSVNDEPHAEQFKSHELLEALKFADKMRKLGYLGYRHVCISSEMENSVGKPGVDSVQEGKTPDGHDYEWTKKHRGEGPKT